MIEGSTWGRAGRFFLRIIFLTLFSPEEATSLLVAIRAVDWLSGCSVSTCAMVRGVLASTPAIVEDEQEVE